MQDAFWSYINESFYLQALEIQSSDKIRCPPGSVDWIGLLEHLGLIRWLEASGFMYIFIFRTFGYRKWKEKGLKCFCEVRREK